MAAFTKYFNDVCTNVSRGAQKVGKTAYNCTIKPVGQGISAAGSFVADGLKSAVDFLGKAMLKVAEKYIMKKINAVYKKAKNKYPVIDTIEQTLKENSDLVQAGATAAGTVIGGVLGGKNGAAIGAGLASAAASMVNNRTAASDEKKSFPIKSGLCALAGSYIGGTLLGPVGSVVGGMAGSYIGNHVLDNIIDSMNEPSSVDKASVCDGEEFYDAQQNTIPHHPNIKEAATILNAKSLEELNATELEPLGVGWNQFAGISREQTKIRHILKELKVPHDQYIPVLKQAITDLAPVPEQAQINADIKGKLADKSDAEQKNILAKLYFKAKDIKENHTIMPNAMPANSAELKVSKYDSKDFIKQFNDQWSKNVKCALPNEKQDGHIEILKSAIVSMSGGGISRKSIDGHIKPDPFNLNYQDKLEQLFIDVHKAVKEKTFSKKLFENEDPIFLGIAEEVFKGKKSISEGAGGIAHMCMKNTIKNPLLKVIVPPIAQLVTGFETRRLTTINPIPTIAGIAAATIVSQFKSLFTPSVPAMLGTAISGIVTASISGEFDVTRMFPQLFAGLLLGAFFNHVFKAA